MAGKIKVIVTGALGKMGLETAKAVVNDEEMDLVGLVDIRARGEKLSQVSELRGIDIKIEKMSIMPDHVHLFVKSRPTASPHWIVQQFKGHSSRVLRMEFDDLRSRLPSLWTRSYYVESCGHISDATVKKYIEDQKRS